MKSFTRLVTSVVPVGLLSVGCVTVQVAPADPGAQDEAGRGGTAAEAGTGGMDATVERPDAPNATRRSRTSRFAPRAHDDAALDAPDPSMAEDAASVAARVVNVGAACTAASECALGSQTEESCATSGRRGATVARGVSANSRRAIGCAVQGRAPHQPRSCRGIRPPRDGSRSACKRGCIMPRERLSSRRRWKNDGGDGWGFVHHGELAHVRRSRGRVSRE
jgi:hypothetical protein